MRIILATIAFLLFTAPSWGMDQLEEGLYSCIRTGEAQIYPNSVSSEKFNSTDPFGYEVVEEKIIFGETLGYPDALLNEYPNTGYYFYVNDYDMKLSFSAYGSNVDFMIDHQMLNYFEVGYCNKF